MQLTFCCSYLRARGSGSGAGVDGSQSYAPNRRPQDSIHYHPFANPTGQPPPGEPWRWKDGSVTAKGPGEADSDEDDDDDDEEEEEEENDGTCGVQH